MGPSKNLVFAGMGFELVGLMLASVYLGSIIDDHMAWKGWATTSLIIVSLVAWLVHIILLVKQIENNEKDQ